jgi:hypothetical protein
MLMGSMKLVDAVTVSFAGELNGVSKPRMSF